MLESFEEKLKAYRVKFDKHKDDPELLKTIRMVKGSLPTSDINPELVEIAKMNIEVETTVERLIEKGIQPKIVWDTLQRYLSN